MSTNSGIEWTNATPVIDREGRRVRYCHRSTNKPGQQIRRMMAMLGRRWCSRCQKWLYSDEVGKCGLCRPHANEAYRENYAGGGRVAIARRVHARKRGVAPVPAEHADILTDNFGGLCAYGCGRQATTWDHVHPVKLGGRTISGNILPACGSCNSSKKDRSIEAFIATRSISQEALEIIGSVLVLEEVLCG